MVSEMICSKQTDYDKVHDKNRSRGQNDGAEEGLRQKFDEAGWLDGIYFDIVSPPQHSSDEGVKSVFDMESETIRVFEPKKEEVRAFPSASLQLITDYGNRFKRLNGERIIPPTYQTECIEMTDRKVSTDAIIRLAGAKFIHSPGASGNDLCNLSHPFGSSFSDLSEKDNRDVKLVLHLLSCAEKVEKKQFDRARKLLEECDKLSSCNGNPVQRLVYYFSEALHERIAKETGKTTLNPRKKDLLDVEKEMMSPNPTVLAFHNAVPFCDTTQLVGIQTITEQAPEAKKIHLIDLAIRNGMHLTFLMQALATRCECPIELLKITAVGTTSMPKIEETGRRLTSFAQSLNLPFSFEVVMVDDIIDFNESLLSLDSDEVVAVHCGNYLRTLIVQPDRLESLMRVIRNINPPVLFVAEVEANLNSPVFVNRFIEALFFFGAHFDCLEDCMKNDESNRTIQESFYFRKGIFNIVAAEGEERTIRSVTIDVWRAFFARFGMVGIEFSTSSKYQAHLMRKKFSYPSSYTLGMDGKSLIIGWKGTPLISVSAWKFT